MTVKISKADDVWTIIHNRPEARNAMDPESADALVEAFKEFNESEKAKVGVFYGQEELSVPVGTLNTHKLWVKVVVMSSVSLIFQLGLLNLQEVPWVHQD